MLLKHWSAISNQSRSNLHSDNENHSDNHSDYSNDCTRNWHEDSRNHADSGYKTKFPIMWVTVKGIPKIRTVSRWFQVICS